MADVASENSTRPEADPLRDCGSNDAKPFKREIVWKNALGFLAFHLLGFYGVYVGIMYASSLTLLWSCLVLMVGGLSVTLGAHRLWSHRAFKANTPVKLVLLLGQTIAGQNCLWVWVRDHRQHHRHSDTDGDPHNASNGFFFSHMGWLMSKKHPEVIEKGRLIDMSDLEADPWVMFQKNHYKKLYFVFSLMLPVLVPVVCWQESLFNSFFVAFWARAVISINGTWSVNSWAHMFGTRPFTKDILPVESRFVAVVALGEGWHNYHHSFPWDYRAAEAGSPFNLTRRIIEFLANRGWIYDLKAATEDMVRRRVVTRGDGTHPVWGHSTFEEFQKMNSQEETTEKNL